MIQSEETKEASVPINDGLSYENGTEVGPQRNEEKNSTSDSQRLSLKNQKSMDNPPTFQKEDGASMTEQTKPPMKQNKSLNYPIGFKHLMRRTISSPTPSVVSLKSNDSMDYPVNFKRSSFSGFRYKTGNSSTPSVVSLKSNDSMDYPVNFKGSSSSGFGQKMGNSSTPSIVSLKSNDSMDYPVNFKGSSSPGFGQKMRHSSTPSSVSLKSNDSMDYPVNFKGSSRSGFGQKMRNSSTPSVVSLKSNDSMDYPVNFKGSSSSGSDDKILEETSSFHGDLHKVFERLERETVTLVRIELKKLHQMLTPNYPKLLWTHDVIGDVFHCEEREKILTGEEEEVMNFMRKFMRMMKLGDFADALSSSHSVRSPSKDNNESHVTKLSELDDQQLKSESNKLRPQLRIPPKEDMDTTFKNLEGNIVVFVENELRSFHKLLNRETVHSQDEDEEVINWEEEEQKKVTKEAFLDMIVTFLRRMKQEELAFALLNKSVMSKCQSKLKSNLKMRLAYVLEGIAKEGHPTLLNKIYTDLYITEGREEVICDHEVKHFEKALKKRVKPLTIRREELFKPITGRDKPVRKVMTEGVAGIGKTVLTQKFALDWAEGKNNQDIQFTFPFSFRGLNLVKEKKFSLVELIHLFFPEIKEAGICRFDHFRVLFIFDGLDECRFALDLKTKEVLTDVTQSASLEVLLANLIKGRLLPSARVWITTRPAAAHLIPPEFVDLMTEVRGFNDPQKEEYFRKRFTEEEESKMVLSHIKSSRSLYIMCHIPVFCWVIATVLEDPIKARKQADLPNSLTEMYILFLVVLSKVKNVKYDKNVEKDPLWTPETREMIKSLGKLAFDQLMKGNLFFYESDLTECGIDVRAASVYSGVFTEIFQEEKGFFHQNMFCFVHLSIQEFLAALHVHLTFFSTGVNLLAGEESVSPGSKITDEQYEHFYKTAVEKAIDAPGGKLDLVLRFLFGLSLETNQRLLQGFVTERKPSSSSFKNIVEYIKKQIEETPCPFDKSNLFHCLNELKELSSMTEIEQILKSGKLETENFSKVQWATLIHILLSSEDNEKNFDVRKYISKQAQECIAPVLLISPKAVLSCCFLNATGYRLLGQILSMNCCFVKDLDLSNNDMEDSGLMLLCKGISNRICRLETLRLSGCLITKEGCAVLASALASNPFYLKELDLSYNHPEEHGVESLSAGLENPKWALQTLRVEPSGLQYLKPGLKKYAVELVLDTTTAHRNLTLSDCNKKVTVGQEEKQPCSANPEKFDVVEQLLCRDRLTGRCYWEVEWRGKVSIGVAYKGIRRRGESKRCGLGMNDQSWALFCSKEGFFVLHNNKNTEVYVEPSNKVGVYLDWPGGTLTFFRVSPDKMTFLHSFNTKFTEPVYPAFRIEADPVNSSLTLC
ncbi:PREDICTED: NACHT, LRR and PYD domains-containing protein 3-like [Poecilia mexicana]|uniref:NACHT, LRR and PYD domains-containing protein 3-like n=1 Tax=Poecilia mexicana TaxID=48701 RepID=UPI00072DE957|nr:PREDICTED: NACHT, LRR and PYD domains-containing protein 3-like [Poecilia mexicana]